MGTNWHLYCRTCDSRSEGNGSDVRHWQAKEVWSVRRAIAEIAAINYDGAVRLDIVTGPDRWVAEHLEHDVALQSEYGDIDEVGQC